MTPDTAHPQQRGQKPSRRRAGKRRCRRGGFRCMAVSLLLAATLTAGCEQRPATADTPPANAAPPPSRGGQGAMPPSSAARPIDAATLAQRISSAGRPTVLYVWASWCKESLQEFPALLDIQRLHIQGQIQLLALAIDSPADVSAYVEPWLAGQGTRFPVFYKDPGETDANLVRTLGGEWLGNVPTAFLYDAAGRLTERLDGQVSREAIRSKLLAGPN